MSVIKACIARFRSQEPRPPQARDKFLSREDFWWNSHDSPSPSDTPDEAREEYAMEPSPIESTPVESSAMESTLDSSQDFSSQLTEVSMSSEDPKLLVMLLLIASPYFIADLV